MSCTNGLLTTTSGSAAGRVPAELRLAPREYLLHPPKSATNARPAATHSLANARPLVFRPMCSARSAPSSVSVAISLVLPIHCSCYFLQNLNPGNSMRLFPDLTKQIGQGHLRQRALETLLGLRESCPFDRRTDLSTVLAP